MRKGYRIASYRAAAAAVSVCGSSRKTDRVKSVIATGCLCLRLGFFYCASNEFGFVCGSFDFFWGSFVWLSENGI